MASGDVSLRSLADLCLVEAVNQEEWLIVLKMKPLRLAIIMK